MVVFTRIVRSRRRWKPVPPRANPDRRSTRSWRGSSDAHVVHAPISMAGRVDVRGAKLSPSRGKPRGRGVEGISDVRQKRGWVVPDRQHVVAGAAADLDAHVVVGRHGVVGDHLPPSVARRRAIPKHPCAHWSWHRPAIGTGRPPLPRRRPPAGGPPACPPVAIPTPARRRSRRARNFARPGGPESTRGPVPRRPPCRSRGTRGCASLRWAR